MSRRAEKLAVLDLKERDVPALILSIIGNRRARLSTVLGWLHYRSVRTLIWIEKGVDLPRFLRRIGWRITARYSAMGFASAVDVAYNLSMVMKEQVQQAGPAEWQDERPPEFASLFSAISHAFQEVTSPATIMQRHINTLKGSAHRCLAMVIAGEDWATDDEPPRLDTPEWEGIQRARLHTALSAYGGSASTSDSAHGAQEPGTT
jgi:hypothetical protein